MDEKIVNELIEELIKLSFAEDIGDGDHTTLCCIPADAIGKQKLLIKEEGILAGVDIARRVFNAFDPELKMEVFMQDGAHVVPGDVPFIVTGKEQSLLQTERLMLNIMQRMSGIATMTARYVKALKEQAPRSSIPARPLLACVSSRRWLSRSVVAATIASVCST